MRTAAPLLVEKKNHLYTLNLIKGTSVYGEELIDIEGSEYRSFTPKRSKLAAVIKKGITPDLFRYPKMLYLGAANGTTVSHASDLMPEGKIYAVEISSRTFRDLLGLAKLRPNIFPILADAMKPETYRYIVDRVDIIYQDISQRDQGSIFIANAKSYLRKNGTAYLMVKANCIDSTKEAGLIYRDIRAEMTGAGFLVKHAVELDPFQKDHMAFIMKENGLQR